MYVYYSNVYIDYYTKKGILYFMYVLKLKSLFYSFIEKNKKKEFQDNIQMNAKNKSTRYFFVHGYYLCL